MTQSLSSRRTPSRNASRHGDSAPERSPELGVCQWFHYEDEETLTNAVSLLHELGVRHLRTGISWADFYRPGGKAWYDRQFEALRQFDLLVSVWHTPPSIAEAESCAAPPRRLQDFADFLDLVIDEYGDAFNDLELWNEPNNRLKWDFERFDPQWKKFGQMIAMAANWAKERGKRTVLGGMIPVDHHWLRLMEECGALEHVDVVAIHGFPGMWWADAPNWDWCDHWKGWPQRINYISKHAGDRPIWVTETGLATWDRGRDPAKKEALQVQMLRDAAQAPAERVYWYSLIDLDPRREAIEGFHVDENEYHLGLVRADGSRKPAWATMQQLLAARRTRRKQMS